MLSFKESPQSISQPSMSELKEYSGNVSDKYDAFAAVEACIQEKIAYCSCDSVQGAPGEVHVFKLSDKTGVKDFKKWHKKYNHDFETYAEVNGSGEKRSYTVRHKDGTLWRVLAYSDDTLRFAAITFKHLDTEMDDYEVCCWASSNSIIANTRQIVCP